MSGFAMKRKDLTAFSGFRVNPEMGHVYGLRGNAFRGINSKGYVRVVSSGMTALAHCIIWDRVNGAIPEGMQINHINGIKTDNRLENLELVTASQNVKHAYDIGLNRADGTNNGRAVLNEKSVSELRRRSRAGKESGAALGRAFSISPHTVRDCVRYKTWRNLP